MFFGVQPTNWRRRIAATARWNIASRYTSQSALFNEVKKRLDDRALLRDVGLGPVPNTQMNKEQVVPNVVRLMCAVVVAGGKDAARSLAIGRYGTGHAAAADVAEVRCSQDSWFPRHHPLGEHLHDIELAIALANHQGPANRVARDYIDLKEKPDLADLANRPAPIRSRNLDMPINVLVVS